MAYNGVSPRTSEMHRVQVALDSFPRCDWSKQFINMELAKINHRIEGEYIAATDRKRQLLQLCGIEQEDLSKVGYVRIYVVQIHSRKRK